MARKKKAASSEGTNTDQKSPNADHGSLVNGGPEERLNGLIDADDTLEDDELKPSFPYQSPTTSMSPSTTVVHKKFGKINCFPAVMQSEEQNQDSDSSSRDLAEGDEESRVDDSNDNAALLEVVLAHEQGEASGSGNEEGEGLDENDSETIVVEVDEEMVDDIDHQNTVIVQVVDEDLMYSEEDGATIWEVATVEEVDHEGLLQESECHEDDLVECKDENFECEDASGPFDNVEELAVDGVSSSGIMEKCDGLDSDVSSPSATRQHPQVLDSDVSDREMEDDQLASRNKLSPEEITQMVLGLNCGSADVAIEHKLCEKKADESTSVAQCRESVITRRSSSDVEMDVETNSRLKGNPLHVYSNTKKNKSSPTKVSENSVIKTNYGMTTPPRRNIISIDDSPLKSPTMADSPGSCKRDETMELPISSIGGSLCDVDLNSVTVTRPLTEIPSTSNSCSSDSEPNVKKGKASDQDLDAKKSAILRNRSESSDTTGSDSGSRSPTVRRSSRIRAPAPVKKPAVMKVASDSSEGAKENPTSSSAPSSRPVSNAAAHTDTSMPVKVKSRWRRSSELEMGGLSTSESDVGTTVQSPSQPPDPPPPPCPPTSLAKRLSERELKIKKEDEERELSDRLKGYEILTENLYLTERIKSKEAKRMVCDCTLSKEEIARGEMGCGEDCLNRLLMIECGSRCPVKNMCSNKRFQLADYAKCEVFKTEKKGFGLRSKDYLSAGTFIMEYVGEVLDPKEFRKRAKEYSKDQNKHYYFMALKSDAIIDATSKGNHSRFINHSCEPNAETQKWTVNGELRIGFFTTKAIPAGEEITFDYQFQRYGKDAQRCFCESSSCRGWIGGNPDSEKSQNQWQEWKYKDSSKKKRDKEKDKRREDIDLEEEIEKLCASGLKSRAHTLTLCRLMVRAEDMASRAKLLKLLRDGEPACRRLFLDYHGLRLMWSWMIDNQTADNVEAKTEILCTLKKLPIPNKTMLMDSKIWGVVERWSKFEASVEPSPPDGDRAFEEESSNDQSERGESEEKNSIEPRSEEKALPQPDSSSAVKVESKVTSDPGKEDERDGQESSGVNDAEGKACAELASLIIQSWSTLKEVFRIPKKERIEQMKEHEREADQHYRELDERYREGDRSSYDRYDRYRDDRRKRSRESPDYERARRPRHEDRSRSDERRHEESGYDSRSRYHRHRYDDKKHDDRKHEERKYESRRYDERRHEDRVRILEEVPRLDIDVKLSKEARRKAFALKVQQEEAEREARRVQAEKAAQAQRQAQEDWWRYHEDRCRQLNLNPHATAAVFNSQYYDPVTNQWTAYTHPQDPNLPQNTYQADIGQAPILFPTDPNTSLSAPISGNAFPNVFQVTATQPSPFDSNQLAPGVSPAPNGISPGVMVGTPISSTGAEVASASEAVVVGQTASVNPTTAVYQSGEEAFSTQDTGPQMYSSGVMVEGQLPAVQYLPPPVPVKLPPKWKSAKDSEGRTYYYHVKTRISQWEPPQVPVSILESVESDSSSTTSSDDNDDDNDEDESDSSEAEEKDEEEEEEDTEMPLVVEQGLGMASHHQQIMLEDPDYPNFSPRPTGAEAKRKRRAGLVQEHIISPRREEDRTDPKIYKQIKDKLRRQKEKRKHREKEGKSSKKRHRESEKTKTVHSLEKPVTVAADTSSDAARRIKDQFRLNMAGVIVQHLNPYRKPDCLMGRITNTDDFKHLARKLTHFVMLKELKHCKSVDDLECNDNVKHKARDFIRKYMAKFGEVYIRPKDDD